MLFSAEPPLQLERLIDKRQEEIKEGRRSLDKILPELQVIMKSSGDRPSIRYFEGKEGQRAIRQEIIMYSQSGDVILNFTPGDHLTAVFPDEEDTQYTARVAKGIFARTIFTTKSEKLKRRWLSPEYRNKSERRFVLPKEFPVSSGMTIYRDRIAMAVFTGKLMGVIVESQDLTNMMRVLFALAWRSAEGSKSTA